MPDQKMILPRKTIVSMSIGVLSLLLVVVIVFLPETRKIHLFDEQICHEQDRLADMKELYPVYTRLLHLKQKQDVFQLVPFDEKETQEQDIRTFGMIVSTICSRTGMDFVAATPVPESITGGHHRVLVDVIIRGNFMRFRDFLLRLLQIPSLGHVQQIQVRPIPENREYALKLWVGLQ